MKLHPSSHPAGHPRSGAALLLSLLILLVLVAIVIQINVSTGTGARIARNDITLTTMDMAAESALLQVVEMLKSDADAESASAAPAGTGIPGASPAGGLPGANPAGGAAGAGGAGAQPASQPCDSRRDEWANPQRTEINDIKLRIVCQDENSKYNILNMLNPDEKEAEAAFERVTRILDACREGTPYDIDQRTAEEMAKVMRDTLTKRKQSKLPRPKLMTDDDKKEDQSLPLTLREFMPLQPFEDIHFRDFRDADGKVVHSITSFLTDWTSLTTKPLPTKNATSTTGAAGSSSKTSSSTNAAKTTGAASGSSSTTGRAASAKGGSNTQAGSGAAGSGSGATGANGSAAGANGANGNPAAGAGGPAPVSTTTGGYGVNVNTAPAAVLKSLFDDRDVNSRFWDKVVEYRNLEDEEEKDKAKKEAQESGTPEEEPQLDEYGQPMIKRRIFSTLADLTKVDGYSDLSSESQAKLNQMLTTTSEVFSVFVIARKATAVDTEADLGMSPAELRKQEETKGDSLLRVIHAVYWRHKSGDETQITPIIRWEVLDYLPYEVLDFPPDDR